MSEREVRTPRPRSQHQRYLFVPEGQSAGIKDKEEVKREKGKGTRETKRRQAWPTDKWFIKVKGEPCVKTRLNFN